MLRVAVLAAAAVSATHAQSRPALGEYSFVSSAANVALRHCNYQAFGTPDEVRAWRRR
jgi:hypothetical protein